MNLFSPEIIISLFTLTILEIVLGIDNVIFLSIITGKLPKEKQRKARNLGLMLAMATRVLLLLSINWLTHLTFTLFNPAPIIGITDPLWIERLNISGKDLVLIIGGCFLLYKSTKEIHEKFKSEETHIAIKPMSFTATIIQIILIDIIFSLDSVITAVGMSNHIFVMIAAVIIAICIMLMASKAIGDFVNKHHSIKMLALAFLMLIGVTLVGQGFDQEIPKGYIYFGMAFSVIVEMLNIKSNKKNESRIR
jgi:predicted tellurium resistance membrane protein TerC